MKVSELFNDRILVEDVVIESKSEGGIFSKTPTLKQLLEEMKQANEFKREQKLFVSDIVFKIIAIANNHPLGLKVGDLIHSTSTGNKLKDYRFLTPYDVICKVEE